MKTCSGCKLDLEPEQFGRDGQQKDGRNRRCRTCVTAYKRAYETRNLIRREANKARYARERLA